METLPAQCAVYVAALLLAAARSTGHEVLPAYVRQGSDFLLPGVDMELKGSGALEWSVWKMDSADYVWILSYHYGTSEPEVHANYSGHVTLFFANGSLLLLNVTTQDSGRYTLFLMKENRKLDHEVRVLEPISEIEAVGSCALCECIVKCKVSGDVWNMTWKDKTGELIQNVTPVGNILELTVLEYSHNCVAWNPVSELWKTCQLPPENHVGLVFIGLLVAALIFSIPTLLCLTKRLLSKIKFRWNAQFAIDDAAEWTVSVSWLLFLICSLTSTSIARSASFAQSASILYSSPVPYGGPEFNVAYLVVLSSCLVLALLLFLMDRLKILRKQWNRYKDSVDIILQLCALGLFIATLAFCFKTYSIACRQPDGFALTISMSALGSILIIALTYCLCRYSCVNGLFGNGAAAGSLDRKSPLEQLEMTLPGNTPTYTEVPLGEGSTVS